MEVDLSTIDLSLYQKQEGRQRMSIDTLNERVYLKKTEQLYHKKYSSSYVTVVLVEKFIDDKLTSSWSWIQPLTDEELLDFPLPPSVHKEYNKKRYRDRKEYYKQYYQQHKDPNTPTRKKWSELTPEEIKERKREQSKLYYQLHRDEVLEKKRQYNQTHKDIISKANKKYYNNHKNQ